MVESNVCKSVSIVYVSLDLYVLLVLLMTIYFPVVGEFILQFLVFHL